MRNNSPEIREISACILQFENIETNVLSEYFFFEKRGISFRFPAGAKELLLLQILGRLWDTSNIPTDVRSP